MSLPEAAPRVAACGICREPASNLCSGCRQAAYCGPDHQRSHWPRHRLECARLPQVLKNFRLVVVGNADVHKNSTLILRAGAVSEEGEGERRECFYRYPEIADTPEGYSAQFAQYLATVADRGAVGVDDALFVQLVLAAEGRLGDSAASPLVFATGLVGPWMVTKRAREDLTPLPGVNTATYPGLYAPQSAKARSALYKAFGRREGSLWLLGPDANNSYLGLGETGPARRLLFEWHERLIARLEELVRLLPIEAAQEIRLLLVDDLAADKYAVLRAPPAASLV